MAYICTRTFSYQLAVALAVLMVLLPIRPAVGKKPPKAKVSQSRHEIKWGVSVFKVLCWRHQSNTVDFLGCLQVKEDSDTALDDSSLTVEIQHAVGEGTMILTLASEVHKLDPDYLGLVASGL